VRTIQPAQHPETPIERATVVMAHLYAGRRLTTADVAQICGITRQGAYRLLDTMSRVCPLLLDGGEWQLTKLAEDSQVSPTPR
jgi:DNA-binding IclR family transcriptional regulator